MKALSYNISYLLMYSHFSWPVLTAWISKSRDTARFLTRKSWKKQSFYTKWNHMEKIWFSPKAREITFWFVLVGQAGCLHIWDESAFYNFTFYGELEHETTIFFFFLWSSMQSFRIQLLKKSPTFGKLKELERVRWSLKLRKFTF